MTVRSTPQERALHRVVVVSTRPCVRHLLEIILDAGPCDVVFVESTAHAYSLIKRVTPDLVIVCLEIDDLDGFQVLSMLKLDNQAQQIPLAICTIERDAEASAHDSFEWDERVFIQNPNLMN